MGITTVEHEGLEADDILGTLARRAEQEKFEVSIVSGDRDLLQIASEHIKIRIPKTKGGKTEVEDYYAEDVIRSYKMTPKQFIELKALMGDTADNIPGVPKVGEKTATDLMVRYGSIENIYLHLDEISKKSIHDSLEQNRELADLSLRLATIKTDCDVETSFAEMKKNDFYTAQAYTMFQDLGFKNLLGRFEIKQGKADTAFQILNQKEEMELFLKGVKTEKTIFFQIAGDEEHAVGMTLSFEAGKTAFCVFNENLTKEWAGKCLRDLIKQKISLATFDIKNEYFLLEENDETPDMEYLSDTLIAAYLLNPLKSDYQPEDIAQEYADTPLQTYSQAFGKRSVKEAFEKNGSDFMNFFAAQAQALYLAAPVLEKKLLETDQKELYRQIEMPLTLVLFHMEKEGVMIRPQELKEYGQALSVRIEKLEKEVWALAGTEFNLNSPKQLGEILFDELHLPGSKKTKTGYSTAADVLEKLAPDYPIVEKLLEYRGLSKLKSTYADGLMHFVKESQRIHSTFHQTIAATGRISSTDPNLQNIPMRTEMGRQIRKVFVARPGFLLTDADYSQIELRVLASLSGDSQLIEAYRQDADIHRMTAAKVFHVAPEDVTPLMRRNAKAVNFGIVYGISSFGLSQDLSISRKEAADYIDTYFKMYPDIKNYLDKCVEEAKTNGYTATLFGRRRPMPELFSSNFVQRSFGERVAKNAPIQGTAADIIKIAMIRVDKRLRSEKMKSRLILQIHDELLVETAEEETEKVAEIMSFEMKNAVNMAVPMEIDLHTGNNWYDAH